MERVFSVGELAPYHSARDFKRQIYLGQFDPTRVALVSSQDLKELGKTEFATGNVTITRYACDQVEIRSSGFPAEGFVVLSDAAFPDWQATIDGQATKIYTTNGVMRGVKVPPGDHTLQFNYEPRRLKMHLKAVLTLWIALIAAWAFLTFRDRERRSVDYAGEPTPAP